MQVSASANLRSQTPTWAFGHCFSCISYSVQSTLYGVHFTATFVHHVIIDRFINPGKPRINPALRPFPSTLAMAPLILHSQPFGERIPPNKRHVDVDSYILTETFSHIKTTVNYPFLANLGICRRFWKGRRLGAAKSEIRIPTVTSKSSLSFQG